MISNTFLKIRIKWNDVIVHMLFIFIVLRLLLPSFVAGFFPAFILVALRIISILLMIYYVLLFGVTPNRPFWLISFVCLCGVIATIVNNVSLVSAIIEYVYIVIECAFVLSVIKSSEHSYAFMTVIKNITLIFAVLNLLIGIVVPTGIPSISIGKLNPQFLYGNLNSTMRSVMPGICCSMVLDKKKGKAISFQTILLFISILYFCFRIYFMATSFLGIILLLVWTFLKAPIKNNYIKVYLGVSVVVLLVEIFVVFLFGHSVYASYISGLFSMKSGFSGREYLWSNILYRIQYRRMFGYGLLNQDEMRQMIGNAYGCHNYYLDALFCRGFVGFVPLLLLFLQPILDKRESITDECYILLGCCCSYLVMFLMEPFIGTEYLHLPIFCISMSLLLKEKKWKMKFKRVIKL